MRRRKRTAAERQETELYEWMLVQRLLNDVGRLEPEKVTVIDARLPGWRMPITNGDIAHAVAANHPELNQALELWWNLSGQPGAPLTFAEIRASASARSPLRFQ